MIFLADENIDGPVVRSLQEVGFPIQWVTRVMPGAKDEDVLDYARANDCILLSFDLGVPSLEYFFRFLEAGITVVRLRWKDRGPAARQQMVETILRENRTWLDWASTEPVMVSATYGRSRYRKWDDICTRLQGR